ncbi:MULTISPECIES: pantetheine-phosphate adenylyltransferase [Caproicibacterium]|jgi:pantetheine-phosphate adenylyltransferase|uniref:Phosphopantetheine adenylyltransferase n=1 Tax=Caproicibacterium lactatifermentans TaxID=2666138 RepID=A0A859DNV1_9FIRM|nr:pantetheine-phosphate adenylyltransferase [Caproicibacterium lactatifermentans]ARP50876.1 pantetheine-phosphate adenylyltransferase [Ruminococcaceae bacterium CPB6]MDD4807509.1 pantetheine-phosphate adenylyltransferase [Oscillospiraceae bacterium]QKN23396.1 pantetheine-phosphate adenylyltransferase [Caproicibacterium lactatifermentans]QKO29926.1 pantetheine-phosphate adenylyltransferase [Caproicibacterium lactatifermentans]
MRKEKIAICPGSFDPMTLGHLDIIRRSCKLFDRVIVAVLDNPAKHTAFTTEEREEMIRRCTKEMPQVEIDSFHGLLAEYAHQKHAVAVVRGLRALSDFEYEFQMSLTNRNLNPDLETIFFNTTAENMFLSSSVVKQIATFGGDISKCVPQCILPDIMDRIYTGGNKE